MKKYYLTLIITSVRGVELNRVLIAVIALHEARESPGSINKPSMMLFVLPQIVFIWQERDNYVE
jgi:hypothetical protein